MNSPLISVIVPVYNTEKYLDQCIQSVLAQTYTNWELLLIDDGSTDSSGAICDRYAEQDSRIRVFHKPNGGVSSARNLGLDNARGEWISFVDADDWIDGECYQKLLTYGVDSTLIYMSNIEHIQDGINATYQLTNQRYEAKEQTEICILFLKQNLINYPFFGFTWNKLFRADIIQTHQIRFLDGFALYEDEIFTDTYCKYASSITTIKYPLYHYRRTNDGLTKCPRRTKDLLILAKACYNAYESYTNPQLKVYELQRALLATNQAIASDNKGTSFRESYILLEKLYRLIPQKVGIRLRLLLICGASIGKQIISIYYQVYMKSFVHESHL